MANPIQNALNFLQTNNVQPNAQNQQYIQALQSGDKNAGQQLANQFCQQNAYLISQLRPSPIPAFQVANPFASMYTGCCNNNVAI